MALTTTTQAPEEAELRLIRQHIALLRERERTLVPKEPVGGCDVATRPTVDEWLSRWLAEMSVSRPRTVASYRYKLILVRHELGDVELAQLTPPMLTAFFASRLGDRRGTTRRHVQVVLGTALRAAVARGLIHTNPLDEVPRVAMDSSERPILSAVECRRLLASVAGDRLEALVVLALHTGAREGELLALTWRDVDLDRRTVSVSKTSGDTGVTATKTKAGRRTVAISGKVADALIAHRARQAEERLRRRRWHEPELVFTSVTGRLIDRHNLIMRWWHPLLSRAGLPRIHFHDLRHTSAVLAMRSAPLPAVSRRLGHSSPVVTAALYGHATREDDVRLAAALTFALGAAQ